MSRCLAFLTIALLMISGLVALADTDTTSPPTAEAPVEEDFHGTILVDDYRWLENADDPEQFKYLLEYSPYQNVKDGVKYPAFLVTGSENDARVDPLHARKMAARLQAADKGGGPICLLVRDASGHGGGTTITTQIDQQAQEAAFLMHFLGMEAPE